jgi:hypothetical protein
VSYYGILLPGFWDGETGEAIAKAGGSQAQLVALYFMANQDANMLGLYRARLPMIRERIRTLSAKALERAIMACGEAQFADYDLTTEHVWVREMAKYRLGLHNGPIKPDDNRTKGAIHLYAKLPANPFLGPFFKRYRADLHLPKARTYQGPWKPLGSPPKGPSKPLGSPFQAPWKPDNSKQRTDHSTQVQNEQLDQEQCADAHRVLVKLAHLVLDALNPDAEWPPISELCERLKDAAARYGLPHRTGREITAAMDSAIAQRQRRAS